MYGDAAHNILSDSMTRSDYGHAISESVSYLQMFVRPVGDILTNETVREVIDMEPDFADEFATCRNHLAVAATGVYQLVSACLGWCVIFLLQILVNLVASFACVSSLPTFFINRWKVRGPSMIASSPIFPLIPTQLSIHSHLLG